MQIQLKPERNRRVIQFNIKPIQLQCLSNGGAVCSGGSNISNRAITFRFENSNFINWGRITMKYQLESSACFEDRLFIQFHFGVKFRSNAPFQQETTSSNLKLALKYHILYRNNPNPWERAQQHVNMSHPLATHDLICVFSKAYVSWPKDKISLLLIDFFCHLSLVKEGLTKILWGQTSVHIGAHWWILVHIGETGPDKDMRTNLCAYWPDLTFLCTAATFVQQQVVRNWFHFRKLLFNCSQAAAPSLDLAKCLWRRGL